MLLCKISIVCSLRELGMQVETRTVKDRFFLLYRKFLDDDIVGLRRGSSDADFQQKEALLIQISEIIKQVDGALEEKIRRKNYETPRSNALKLDDDVHDAGNDNDSHADTIDEGYVHLNHAASAVSNDVDQDMGLNLKTLFPLGSSSSSGVVVNGNKRQRVTKEPRVTQEALLLVLQSLERQKSDEMALRERELQVAEAKLQLERETLELNKARETREMAANAVRDEQMKTQLTMLTQLLENRNYIDSSNNNNV